MRYQEIPADLVAQRFAELGLGEQFGQAYVSLLAATVGLDAVVTEDVEKILGRPAQTFEQWVVDHRDLFTQSARGRRENPLVESLEVADRDRLARLVWLRVEVVPRWRARRCLVGRCPGFGEAPLTASQSRAPIYVKT